MDEPIKTNPVIKIVIGLLVCGILLAIGLSFNAWNAQNQQRQQQKQMNANHQTALAPDRYRQQDLSRIAITLDNLLVANNYSFPANLNKLSIPGLHYPLSDYSYSSTVPNDGSPTIGSYQLCATFTNNTFSSTAYLDTPSFGDGGESVVDYAVHGQGKQCFEDDIAPDTEPNGNMSLVLTEPENTAVSGIPQR